MADAELRFIYSLLNANRGEQNHFYAQQIPRGLFKQRLIEIDWVFDHKETFGEFPSVFKFQKKFEVLPRHRESLVASLQPILDLAMFNQMRKANTKVKELLDKGRPLKEAITVYKIEAEKLRTYDSQYVDVDSNNSDLAVNRYKERQRQQRAHTLLDSPWRSLNKLIKFFSPGELVTIAARPSMGKTWITLCMCDHFAATGNKVAFFSEEMPAEQVNDRLEALRYKLPYEDMRAGVLSLNMIRLWRLRKMRARRKKYEFITTADQSGLASLAHLESKIVQYKPAVVGIDGAYLIEPEGVAPNAKYHEKIGFLTKRLKKIAIRNKVVVIAVIQMNRTAEQKDQTKGNIASVYGSDTWAQDTDWLLDISGKRGSAKRNISLLKGRESNIGEIWTTFQLDPCPRFTELRGSNVNQSEDQITFKQAK
jgi:replicative DNA helicase